MTVEEYEKRGFTYLGKRRETPFFVNMRTMVGPIFDCGVGSMAHKGVLQPYLPFVLRITGFWDLRSTGGLTPQSKMGISPDAWPVQDAALR